MAKKQIKIFEPILTENLQADAISDWVEQEYGFSVEERYLKKLATEAKGDFALFASRLQGHVCNLRFEDNAKLYPDWPKNFSLLLKAKLSQDSEEK